VEKLGRAVEAWDGLGRAVGVEKLGRTVEAWMKLGRTVGVGRSGQGCRGVGKDVKNLR
jgi:hypothetical protein